MRRIRTCDLQLTGPKTIRPKKFEKITQKKLFAYFWKKRKFSKKKSLNFLEGRELIITRQWVFFEIFPKNMIFFSKNRKKNRWKKRPITRAKKKDPFCSKFFECKIFLKKFWFFHKRRLIKASKGHENNQRHISSSLCAISRKKTGTYQPIHPSIHPIHPSIHPSI